MAVRLSHIRADRRTLTLNRENYEITFTFRPSEVNEDRITGGSGERFAAFLAEALVSWDILDDNDEPCPITEDFCRQLPMALTGEIVAAIFKDTGQVFSEGEGGTSSAG